MTIDPRHPLRVELARIRGSMNKELILDEIRRIARESGGVPPGRERFQKETGLSASATLGRHWARWSDAVREAGFEPNEYTRALSDGDALPGIVTMVRELGRLPTHEELKLRRRSDRTIPSHSVFRTKAQLADRLARYCSERPELADVLPLCAAHSAPLPQTKRAEMPVLGEVYLMKSGRNYKIGRSISAAKRERELQIQLPDKATRIHTIRTDDPVGIERYWHERFASKRLNGEWFKLDATDVNAFRRRKTM